MIVLSSNLGVIDRLKLRMISGIFLPHGVRGGPIKTQII